MIITFYGENYFKLQSGDATLLIDPTNQRSFKGAIAAINTSRPSSTEKASNDSECFWIDHQGEFEIKDIHIRGWSVGNVDGVEKTVYLIDFDEIKFAVFGDLPEEFSKDFIEYFEEVDVAIVPAGGKPLVSPENIARLVRQIEPGMVVPSSSKNLSLFLKEFNNADCAKEEKLVFKKKDIVQNAMQIRCLEEKK